MKAFYAFFLASFVLLSSGLAQSSCCDMKASPAANHTVVFASLADGQDFRNAHELPFSYQLTAPDGEILEFETQDGSTGKAYAVMASEKTTNYVLMIHEWWGLNDHIKREADQLAEQLGNVNVLALDLYDGNVATTREDASKYMQAVKAERAQAIIAGAIAYAGEDAKIATIGWCFGGGWSLQASLLAGEQAGGCIIYYGMPIRDAKQLEALQTDVLGIFASEDRWITPAVVKEFEESLEAAGKESDLHIFEANHAFANPSSDRYDKEDAEKAYELSLAYLKKRMK